MDNVGLHLRFRAWAPLRVGAHASYYDSHSQFGEDMVLRAILGDSKTGFYVDVGAHHPVYFSNTYYFYRRGWRGVNIDATPGSMALFQSLRGRDVNLELCLTPRAEGSVEFFLFDQPALNTYDRKTADYHIATKGAKLVRSVHLPAMTLTDCLESYTRGLKVDFLSIDVEGMDEPILRSVDWNRHRPRAVVFEARPARMGAFDEMPIVRFFASVAYEIVAVCGPSIIVRDTRQMVGMI